MVMLMFCCRILMSSARTAISLQQVGYRVVFGERCLDFFGAFFLVPIGLHFANAHAIYEMLSLLESNEALSGSSLR
jgi:hypothetical protein